ncbi:MAG: aldehyde dehydrogenase family protein [Rickettsiales bacterium]|nr:aldehyde dehydrogenase family protein [Rickettsiales bacterium]
MSITPVAQTELAAPNPDLRTHVTVVNPFDSSDIEEITLATPDQVDAALESARAAFADRAGWLSPQARIDALHAIANKVEAEKHQFASIMIAEGGKPQRDTFIEIDRAIFGIRHAASCLHEMLAGVALPQGLVPAAEDKQLHTKREPIGVVVAISAFNHPLNLLVHQVITAIAVGAPVILKPDLRTPLTAAKLVEIIHGCGVPEPFCQLLLCEDALAEPLACDARVDFLSFIGSAKVGWHLRSKLAPGTRCALEHGGIAPALILPHANVSDRMVNTLIKGSMAHAGQVCVSTQRIYAPWNEAGNLARKLAEAAEALKVGDPANEHTDVGPIITPQALARIHKSVMDAMAGGGKVMCGAEAISESLYKPTVLFDVPDDAALSTQEIFGPVVAVYGYESPDEALARINTTPYAFQASVWGADIKDCEAYADRIDAAAVMINDTTAFRVDYMPFGGRKQSGLGVGGIAQTMHDYTQHKLIVR